MRRFVAAAVVVLLLATACYAADAPKPDKDGFYSLFDGKSLDGWKVGKNAASFKVQDGLIVANGDVAHLFYDGPVKDHNFKNFHLKAEVMTFPKANAGIYFHTQFQEAGWPGIGYEVQVNQTHSDPKKSSGLYGIKDVFEAPAKDNVWYTQEIIVQGKRIITKVDGKTLVDYTEPNDVKGGRKLSSGTFALQAHDPGSKVYFKSVKVKPLED
jgi:opacity protein-like surface antigen